MILLRYFRLLSKHEPPAVSRAVINIVILTEAAAQGGHCLAHLVGVVPLHLQLLVLCSGRQRKHAVARNALVASERAARPRQARGSSPSSTGAGFKQQQRGKLSGFWSGEIADYYCC